MKKILCILSIILFSACICFGAYKKGATTQYHSWPEGTEYAHFSSNAIISEIVTFIADTTVGTITCGGDNPDTKLVRIPLACFVDYASVDAAANATPTQTIISGYYIYLGAIDSGDTLHVLIFGRP